MDDFGPAMFSQGQQIFVSRDEHIGVARFREGE